MTEVFPDYYPNFKCIADKCRHNCCIGWEIDIDEKTMELYKSIERDTGEKFSENIEENHFKLKEGDKCSFLRHDGLCDIICKFGESALCEICTLHPRFKNFYDNFNEVGLGLSCEEAARIILSRKNKFCIPLPTDAILTDEEKDFFAERKKVFDVLQNREKPFSERFNELCKSFDIQIDTSALREIYIGLERLDDSWTDELENLREFEFDKGFFDKYPLAFENLAVYFIFRHFGECMWDEDYVPAVRFALMSVALIGALFARYESENPNFEKLVDIARMYSSEIEYSDENTEKIMFEVI